MKIPKTVHMTWVSADICDDQNPMILNGLRNTIDMNPDWRVVIYTDHEVNAYLRANLSDQDWQLIEGRPFVERSDVWRLFVMRNLGGIYLDLDRLVNRPWADIIHPHTECFLPTIGDYDFSHDIMISVPGYPLWQTVIDLNLSRRRSGADNIYYLGPQTFMNAVSKFLIGQSLEPDPGRLQFQRLRQAIMARPELQTYKEDNPDYTVVYQHDASSYRSGDGGSKQDFYRRHRVRHWLE